MILTVFYERSNDVDEEKAKGAELLPKSVPRSDDDRAKEKPPVKSAVAATPGPVKKAQLMNAATKVGLDDEMSQRLWILLTEEVSAAEPRPVSEADSRGYWSAVAADVAKAASWFPALDRWLTDWFREEHGIPFGREIFDMITYGRAPCGFCRQDSPERNVVAEFMERRAFKRHWLSTQFHIPCGEVMSGGKLILGGWLLVLAATLLRIALTSEEDSAPSPTAAAWPPCESDSALSSLSPVLSLWYDSDCLCGTANATQTATALSAQLTGGLEPGAILSVVLSGLGLFLLSRLGGIPVPDRPEGVVLYVIWMAVQLL